MPYPIVLSLAMSPLVLACCAAPASLSTTAFPPVEEAIAAVAAQIEMVELSDPAVATTAAADELRTVAPAPASPPIDPVFQPGVANLRSCDGDWGWSDADRVDWVLLGVKLTNGRKSDVWFVRLAQKSTEDESLDSQTKDMHEFRVPAPVAQRCVVVGGHEGERAVVPVFEVLPHHLRDVPCFIESA
jgi:hypothetical protein